MENYQYHIFSPYRVCPLGAYVLIVYVMVFAKANDIKLQPFEVVKIVSEERVYRTEQRFAGLGLHRLRFGQ